MEYLSTSQKRKTNVEINRQTVASHLLIWCVSEGGSVPETLSEHEKYQQVSYNHSRTLNPSTNGAFGIKTEVFPIFLHFGGAFVI